MKKIIFFAVLSLVNFCAFSQALEYEDLAILVPQNSYNGECESLTLWEEHLEPWEVI